MRYMLLIYGDEKSRAKMSEPEVRALFKEFEEFTESIRNSGAYQASDPLQPTISATTVRMKNGKTLMTDGPFAETKEQLGGYYIVEAKNLDEALSIAGRIPSLHIGGSIEVRPIREIGPSR